MDDLALTRKLEIELDDLRDLCREPLEQTLLAEARKALKEKKLTDVQRMLADLKGRTAHSGLAAFLVSHGNIPSMAHANRLIFAGAVTVDGRVAKLPNMNIREAESIVIKGKEGDRELRTH